MSSCIYYSCLFTKHKSQKRKIWQDGKLKISPSGSISIYDISSNIISGNDATPVDTMCIHTSQVGTIKSGSELESEKFLITVEGEWRQHEHMASSTSTSSSNVSHASVSTNTNSIHQNSIKAKNGRDGMKKLLAHKFRKPTKFIPGGQNQNNPSAVIRKAPLQPGQYLQQFQGPSIQDSSNDSSSTSIQHNVGLGGGMRSHNSRNNLHAGNTLHSHPFHHDIRHERYPQEYKRDEQNIPIHPSNGQSTTPVNNSFDFHQTMPSTKQTKSCNNNSFVSNEFNPSSYYEESDEEGEQDDDERTVHHWNNHESLELQKKNFESNANHHAFEQDRDKCDQDHLSKDDDNSQTGDSLSKSELMDLFAPRQDEIESQRQDCTMQTNDDDEQPNSFLRGLLQRDEAMAASVTHGISSNTIWNMENENSDAWNADEVVDAFQDFHEEDSKEIHLDSSELNSTENQYEDPKENENGADKDGNITFSITMDDESSSDDDSVDD